MSIRCPQCPVKDGVIKIQQIKIAQLESRIKQLEGRIKRAQGVADVIITNANDVFSAHQPRGKWAYTKGTQEAAESIKSALR